VNVSLPLSSDGTDNSHRMSQSESSPTAPPNEHAVNYLQLVEPSASTDQSVPEQHSGTSEQNAEAYGYLQLTSWTIMIARWLACAVHGRQASCTAT